MAGNKRTKALITKRREHLSNLVNGMVLVKKTAQLKDLAGFWSHQPGKADNQKRKRVPSKDDASMAELSTQTFLGQDFAAAICWTCPWQEAVTHKVLCEAAPVLHVDARKQ